MKAQSTLVMLVLLVSGIGLVGCDRSTSTTVVQPDLPAIQFRVEGNVAQIDGSDALQCEDQSSPREFIGAVSFELTQGGVRVANGFAETGVRGLVILTLPGTGNFQLTQRIFDSDGVAVGTKEYAVRVTSIGFG